MKYLFATLIALSLVGCAGRWEHASKRRNDFIHDDRECQILAGGVTLSVEPGGERIRYESCMWDRGWHKKSDFWFFEPTPR